MRLAQTHYGHIWRLIVEFLWFPLLPAAKRAGLVRVENADVLLAAHEQGKGVLILTGHFGNFEVATAAGIAQFPQARGHFHFIRRPFKPRWLEDFVYSRSRRPGLRRRCPSAARWTCSSTGSPQETSSCSRSISTRLGGTVSRSSFSATRPALSAAWPSSPAPPAPRSLPASAWREADGRHVLRFEQPLPPIECEDYDEEIRRNTRAYNAALERLILRHPEQWWWMHRRWKIAGR